MKHLFVLLITIQVAFFASPHLQAQAPDPAVDLQGYISYYLNAGQTQVIVPAGQYYVTPQSKHHLYFENIQNVDIIADGVEMVCTQTTRALSIINCSNFSIRGLTIDYDPLPFTQGRIISISADKRTHTVELTQGYPTSDKITGSKYQVYDPTTYEMATYTYYNVSYQPNGSQQVIVTKPDNYLTSHAIEEVNDLVVIEAEYAPNGSMDHAILVSDSTEITLEQITLYASNCFGFFEKNCSDNQYLSCTVDRRPLVTDLKPRDIQRLASLYADAYHSKFAGKGPVYQGCMARYMGDDGFAINGDFHLVLADGNTLRVVGKNGQDVGLQVGDPVELVSYTGERLPDATVTAVGSGGTMTGRRSSPPARPAGGGGASRTRSGP